MLKTRNKLKTKKDPTKKGDKQIKKVVHNVNDRDGCVCNNLKAIVEQLQSVSDKLVAETLDDSYDKFSKYISSLLRGLPQKEVLSIKKKVVNDIVEALNAHKSSNTEQCSTEAVHNQRSDSKLILSKKITKYNISGSELSNVASSSEELNVVDSIPGQNDPLSHDDLLPVYLINPLPVTAQFADPYAASTSANITQCSPANHHVSTVRTVSSTAEGTLLSITLPISEGFMGENATESLPLSAEIHPRTRGQKRKHSSDNQDTKRIAVVNELPETEIPSVFEDRTYFSFPVGGQDGNENNINFEDGSELAVMKIDEEIIDDISIPLIKQEPSDSLEEDKDIVPELFICAHCSTDYSFKHELVQHLQQEHSDSNADSDKKNVTGKATNKSQLKVKYKRKRNCCLYCKKIYTNLTRHILQIHQREKEVRQYRMTHDRETCKKLMGIIINKGNYEYNKRMIAKGHRNQLIPKRTKRKNDIAANVVCKNCFGTFSSIYAYKHYKNCFGKKANEEVITKKTSVINELKRYTPDLPEASEELKADVLKKIKRDYVSEVAKSDPLILRMASKSYDGKKDAKQILYVVSKMRETSKLLLLMKKRNKDIDTFEDCISPQCFDDIIDIVKKLSKSNNRRILHCRIQRVGTSLRQCAAILRDMISEHASLVPEEKVLRKNVVDDFIQLMKTKWKQELPLPLKYDSGFQRKALHLSVIPCSDDVILAFKHVTKLNESLVDKLKSNTTNENYCMLAKNCIVQLVILNRRRPDEISHAFLKHYNEKSTTPLIGLSKNGVEEFRVHGASCEVEVCLLTKPMIQAIDALVVSRDKLKITSMYLFSQPNSLERADHIVDGEVAVTEMMSHLQFKLKKPANFTSSSLVHHKVQQMTLIDTIIPGAHADDVNMAFSFITKSYKLLINKLEAEPTPARYCVLAKRCIAHLIILNRCKQTKATEVLLEEYEKINNNENIAVDDYAQIYNIPAPVSESSPLLLNNEMKLAIDALVASRNSLQITDKYLFAQPYVSECAREKVFNGEEIIIELGKILLFQLKVPDCFTIHGLRYHTVNQDKLLGFSTHGPKTVPDSEDVISLFKAITSNYQLLIKELEENSSSVKYCELSKMCIAHLIILNKCEQTEVTQALLQHYERVRNVSVCQSVFSKDPVQVFEFPGSESDSPSLLLSKLMKQAIDTLVVSRYQLGITSKYLFALPNINGEERVFSGQQAINELKISRMFIIRQPDIFTADTLKNHDVKQKTLLGTRLNIDIKSIPANKTKDANGSITEDSVASKENYFEQSSSVEKNDLTETNFGKTSQREALIKESVSDLAKENFGSKSILANKTKHANGSITEDSIGSKQNYLEQSSSIERNDLTEKTVEETSQRGALIKESGTDLAQENVGSIKNHVETVSKQNGQSPKNLQESTFASKFARFCQPILDSDSVSDNTCQTPIKRVRWSDEEKEVVYKYFGRHLLNLQNPGRQEINKMLQKEPILKNRSLDQVNVYVNNIVTGKTKLTPYVVKHIKELCPSLYITSIN